MKGLQVFDYRDNKVRTIEREDGLWWVLKDVCEVLDLKDTNKVADRLDGDELTRIKVVSGGQNREMYAVNESGLYNVILRSDKPEAKQFKRWVTHDILPAIRRHGMYAVDDLLNDPDLAIQAFTALKEEREKNNILQIENVQQKQIIGELKPRADYTDRILSNPGLVTITQIAKDYGMSGKALNKMLADLGVQYKQSGQWLLYAKYHDAGYTHSKTIDITRSDGRNDVVMETKWTQKGRLFVYELLKSEGILPIIEKSIA